MYWTLELASKLEDAPWPATKDELIDSVQTDIGNDFIMDDYSLEYRLGTF